MPLLCDIAMILMNFHTIFDHIWTNLLTQCTPVPVPVFCYFSISGFPLIKSTRKFREKYRKNQRTGSFAKRQRGARGAPGGQRARPHPWMPPFAYLFPVTRNPRGRKPFSRSLLCSATAALPRSGAPEDLFPAPCRREESPSGASPPSWMLPG